MYDDTYIVSDENGLLSIQIPSGFVRLLVPMERESCAQMSMFGSRQLQLRWRLQDVCIITPIELHRVA
jgi:hypothetical protein